jgi:hypothetical protein
MRKTFAVITALLLFIIASVSFTSLAATLQITKIGSLDATGKNYPEWWYTGSNPTLSGKAAASSDVSVKVGTDTYTVKTSTAGDWSVLIPKQTGDLPIEITSGAEVIKFTLHLGQNVPTNLGTTQTGQSTMPIPVTGLNQLISIAFGLGVLLLATYFYFWGAEARTR